MRSTFLFCRLLLSVPVVCAFASVAGCADSPPKRRDAGGLDAGAADAAMRDAGPARVDAGLMDVDADMGTDAGSMDVDADVTVDAGMRVDAGPRTDAGPADRCAGVVCTSLDTACQLGACNPATGMCRATNRPDGTTCSRSRCITGGSCMTGTCVGGMPVDCSALTDRCHVGSCNPATGMCDASPIALDCRSLDAQCVYGACNPATGMCSAFPRTDGTVCDDGAACTMGTMCTAGACIGGTVMASPGDVCASPATLLGTPGTQIVTGDTRCATNDRATSCGTGGAAEVFYTFTLTTPRELVAETVSPTAFDTVLELRSATCGTGAVVACDNDSGAPVTGGRLSRISTTLGPGTYFLTLDGVGPGAIGPYTLRFSLDAQDTCTAPPTITAPAPATTITLTGSTALATSDYAGTCGTTGTAPDHVYALTVASAGTYVFETRTTATSDFDTVVYVRRSPCVGGAEVGCNDNGPAGTDPMKSRLQVALVPGTYYVFVDGASGASGSYRLDISQLCATGLTPCGVGSCADLNYDRNNCGVCGRVCPGTQVCVMGACSTAPPTRYNQRTPTVAEVPWIDACAAPGSTTILTSTDDSSTTVMLPFSFRYWATNLAMGAPINVCSNGWIGMDGVLNSSLGGTVPSTSTPNAVIAPHWGDDYTRATGVCVATVGTAPNRQFVVEWNDTYYCCGGAADPVHNTFEIILSEASGTIDFVYQTMTGARGQTMGIEDQTGANGINACPGGTGSCIPTDGQRVRFDPIP